MRVPKGGSSCKKCEYLKDAEKGLCGNEYFVAWHGSDKIPAPINEYCSDWFDWKPKDESKPAEKHESVKTNVYDFRKAS